MNETGDVTEDLSEAKGPPSESSLRLFLRFLRFGALAWGGPVAQIAMVRQELVEREKWISKARFNKLLAIYQLLPGPEAHELCVHMGMIAKGRLGGVLAGLGFMLPGFVLMFLLSWLYVAYRITDGPMQAVFLGIQPAVIALIFRASHRIATHVFTSRALLLVGLLAFAGDLAGIPFWATLITTGAAGLLLGKNLKAAGIAVTLLYAASAAYFSGNNVATMPVVEARQADRTDASPGLIFGSGLRAGLLTFGGAYTAIPFVQRDAVEKGRWMTNVEFLDGIAISGTLPAPLIIFSTFVGYIGGGALGALLMTAGIFVPAFAFSLLFFHQLERVMNDDRLKDVLEAVAAGVVGIIGATLIRLSFATLTDGKAILIFALALIPLYKWKSKAAIPVVVFASGLIGLLLY